MAHAMTVSSGQSLADVDRPLSRSTRLRRKSYRGLSARASGAEMPIRHPLGISRRFAIPWWLRPRLAGATSSTSIGRILNMAAAVSGTIKRIVSDKGFGFVAAADGTEYFFHNSACVGTRFDELREGQAVTFEKGQGPKGPRAEKIRRRNRSASSIGRRPVSASLQRGLLGSAAGGAAVDRDVVVDHPEARSPKHPHAAG